MPLIINPGSGPVAQASAQEAEKNILAFAEDLRARGWETKVGERGGEDDGRYTFLITVGGVDHEIEMPGAPLERVRYLDDSQNIWDFPRLYVDGSSWVWKFALNICNPSNYEGVEE